MPSSRTLLIAAAAAVSLATPASAEPLKPILAPATTAAPVRAEAAMFNLTVMLAQAAGLDGLLLESGIAQDEAASAAVLAQGQVDDHAACRVKLTLSRNPDTGAISLQRMALSTASAQTVIEARSGKLRVISTAAKRLRIA